MYDEIKNFVNILSFIIFVLGFVGYMNSRNSKLPKGVGATKAAYNTHPEATSSETKRHNILRQFGYSFMPSQYKKLAEVKTGSMIRFVTLLSLISTLCMFLMFFITFVERGGADAFLNWIPDFEIQNGRLSLKDHYYIHDTQYGYIYLTDQIDGFRQRDMEYIMEQGYSKAFLGGSERISFIDNGQYVERYYSELVGDLELNREIVMENLKPMLPVQFGILSLVFFVGRTFWYFGCVALYFLAAFLIMRLLRRKIPARVLFRTAVYAKVPMFAVTTFWKAPYLSGISRIVFTAGFMAFVIRYLIQFTVNE